MLEGMEMDNIDMVMGQMSGRMRGFDTRMMEI
jgi:hypothetical protein